MGIACLQCAFVLAFAGLSLASDSMAQQVLDQRITVQVKNKPMSTVLQSLEKAAKVRFAYIPQLITASQKLSVETENETLRSVLDRVLLPNGLAYEVSDNFIVLKQRDE